MTGDKELTYPLLSLGMHLVARCNLSSESMVQFIETNEYARLQVTRLAWTTFEVTDSAPDNDNNTYRPVTDQASALHFCNIRYRASVACGWMYVCLYTCLRMCMCVKLVLYAYCGVINL